MVVLDCAHNVASAAALVETLLESFPKARRLLIFAGSSDKDLLGMCRVFAPHFERAFLTRYANSLRSVPPELLAEMMRSSRPELPCSLHSTAAEAWHAALAAAAPDDVICVTGSVFLAGELRPILAASPDSE
jgi:dihydrofolate synthase/folylpolyglutamate synthase